MRQRRGLQKMSIRTKLIIMSLLFLSIPSLLIGIIGYQSSTNSLNTLGSEGLQTNVRLTIEMIEMLDNQVKQGTITLEDAQEEVKIAILGKKDEDGNRPINSRLNLGKDGFIFIINSEGVELAHPNFEGQNVWDVKTTDGVYSTKEVIKAANNGGGFAIYEWPLPNNPDVSVPKITYAEKEPNWNWIVCAGAYLPDFNAGANKLLYVLLITIGVSMLIGILSILWFSKKLTKPIRQVAQQAKLIASGSYTHETIKTKSKDETGELVLNFNIMKENQKKAEDLIRKNEAFLQSVTTYMGEGIVVMDTEGRLTFMNPVAEQLLGWREEECLNENIHDRIHRHEDGSSFPYDECLSRKAQVQKKEFRIAEDWFQSKDGKAVPSILCNKSNL